VTQPASSALRIGCVKYLNAQPLIHGWNGPVVFDHPATLCGMLAAGELDVALVSSFEFLRNPVYSIADNLAVAADGPVHSVFVAHLGAFQGLDEIVIDPASLTSVNLLRCLLAEMKSPAVLRSGVDDVSITQKRGRLLIGDQAIRFRQQHAPDYNFWDLGAEWWRMTGLPFVFALWLIRPGTANAPEVASSLRALRDSNLAALDSVITAQSEFSPEFCAYYFRECLRFQLADAEKQGLLMFRSQCQKHGILPLSQTPLPLL
jgi:chorismate dehydratase